MYTDNVLFNNESNSTAMQRIVKRYYQCTFFQNCIFCGPDWNHWVEFLIFIVIPLKVTIGIASLIIVRCLA